MTFITFRELNICRDMGVTRILTTTYSVHTELREQMLKFCARLRIVSEKRKKNTSSVCENCRPNHQIWWLGVPPTPKYSVEQAWFM